MDLFTSYGRGYWHQRVLGGGYFCVRAGGGIFVKIAFPTFGWKFVSNLPVLISLVVGYVLSIILGIVDFSAVGEAAWIGIPKFTLPKFSASAISVMVPIAIVTMVEHFGRRAGPGTRWRHLQAWCDQLSGLGLAAIFGVVLNLILRPKDSDSVDS
jgi:xanthine/uracil permease